MVGREEDSGQSDLLPREIARRARTRAFGRRVYYLPEVDSTNRVAAELAAAGEAEGAIIVADYQTAGRGRWARRWESAAGKNVLFSLILRPEAPAPAVLPVTLAFSASIADTLGSIAGREIGVKWPNDVVVDGRKICGILAEGAISGGRMAFVVVGVGINVNARIEEFPDEFAERSCSVYTLTGREWDRTEVIARVLTALERTYLAFAAEGFSELLGLYRSKLAILGRNVRLSRSGSERVARVVGVAEDGALLVESDGETEALYDDEVTMLTDGRR